MRGSPELPAPSPCDGGTEPTAGPTGTLALAILAAVEAVEAETRRLGADAATRPVAGAWDLGCDAGGDDADARLAAGITRALADLPPEEIAALGSGLRRLLLALRAQPGAGSRHRAAGTHFRPPPIS